MDTTFATNLLFYALSIFFILLILCLLVASIYTVKIFRIIKREAEKIEQDIDAVRDKMKNGGMAVTSFLLYIASFFNKKHKKSKR